MEHQLPSPEVTYVADHGDGVVKKVIKVTIILSVLTVAELALGFIVHQIGHSSGGFLVLALKGAIIILTIAKAYYITAYFMHLKDEVNRFVMTILLPLALFIWFIIAFIADGNSWRNLRNTQAGSKPNVEQQATPAQKTTPAAKPGAQH